jgi:hypothetical protein
MVFIGLNHQPYFLRAEVDMLAGGQVFGEDINANRVEEQTSGPPHVFFDNS